MQFYTRSIRHRAVKTTGLIATLCGVLTLPAVAEEQAGSAAVLADMNLEDVMKVQVSSVSRKAQNMSDTAAAVYVITQEDIRRSGVTNIADALRMAPGLQVARDSSSSLAISSRGFNGRYANKLLVLIDGRTVYTPIFSGVFWDLQDTLLEDIERIEVIRGPGAAMWGANAVNGVINIITKATKKTQGNLLTAGAGNQERGFVGFRHGGQIGEDTTYRVYGKAFDRNATYTPDNRRGDDDWRSAQAGFRVDRLLSGSDKLTVQGDLYRMYVGETVRSNTVLVPPYTRTYAADDRATGGNLLARWESRRSENSDFVLQTYLDRVHFEAPKLSTNVDTFDVDFQYRWRPNPTHDVMWGVSYRNINFTVEKAQELAFRGPNQHKDNLGIFAQDDIALIQEKLRLTLGAKLERNYFGDTQFQPNVRLLWTPNGENTFWAAVSRAARTPSVGENNARVDFTVVPPVPIAITINGNNDLKSEKLTAYELGYRSRLHPGLTVDVTAFVNHYDRLIALADGTPVFSVLPVPHLDLPLNYINERKTYRTRGLELVVDWRPLNWMRIEGNYTYLHMDDRKVGQGVVAPDDVAGFAPRHQANLRWQMDLSRSVQMDFWLRHVGKLEHSTLGVDAYTTLDVRLGWKPRKDLELSLVGQNLLDRRHFEFHTPFGEPGQIPRSAYVKMNWTF